MPFFLFIYKIKYNGDYVKAAIVSRLEDNKFYINKNYIDFVLKLGYEYSIITDDSTLDGYDLFILPGGYDINPIYYNEDNLSAYGINEYNDCLDFKIIKYCIKKSIPLIGICRGMQAIAVLLGCTLKQDINNHMSNNHFIKLDNKYYLVNSYHHQSIDYIPSYIEILAKSIDNEIEIIKYNNIIGFQFHPEKLNYSLSNFNLKLSH